MPMPVLSIFGELETFIADELYPYRYVITPVLSAVGLGLLFLAYRRGAHLLLWRHRLASAVVGVPVLVGAGGERVEEALNLGRLKATDGAFNYEIPAGIDLKGVKSVVVWCRQFDVLFAVAAPH